MDAYICDVAMNPASQSVVSVASFLNSLVDVKAEWQLERIGAPKVFQLKGKMAITNTKMTYHYFQLCIKFEFSVQQ